jgi:predicted nucleic acid-binding protein
VPERWVVNASPIILLCKISYQHLLPALTDEVVVPQAVVDEIDAGPVDDDACQWLTDKPLPLIAVPPVGSILSWDLGIGETAVLSHALLQS